MIINFMVGMGKVFGILMAYVILDNIKSGNWRLLMTISSIPCFLVAIGTYFYIYESARFLLISNR